MLIKCNTLKLKLCLWNVLKKIGNLFFNILWFTSRIGILECGSDLLDPQWKTVLGSRTLNACDFFLSFSLRTGNALQPVSKCSCEAVLELFSRSRSHLSRVNLKELVEAVFLWAFGIRGWHRLWCSGSCHDSSPCRFPAVKKCQFNQIYVEFVARRFFLWAKLPFPHVLLFWVELSLLHTY